jgi:AAA domain, putative AbiEii toxin, Type IV TA system
MFFSKEQIEQSIKRLNTLNPFFGITFLAFKKEMLPIGNTESIKSIQVLDNFLQKYYRPVADFAGFYTPFKTWNNKKKRWNAKLYAHTLHVTAARTFSDVLIHPKGSLWGWETNYIHTLEEKYLNNSLIPTFDLAVWLFRFQRWNETTQPNDVIDAFFTEFSIKPEEYTLFDPSIPPLANPWLQTNAINTETLLDIIGPLPNSLTEGATLQMLKLVGVGPANKIELNLAPRLNLITGDNGLGKTFLLECAWWALTGIWAGYPAHPRQDAARDVPRITFRIEKNDHKADREQIVKYNWDQLKWITPTRRTVLPGLSIYSQADGSFTIWDPAKHMLAREERYAGREEEALTRFSRFDVWNGVKETDQYGRTLRVPSNGLIYDWVRWQEAADQTRFEELSMALHNLSPDPEKEPLIPGKPTRMSEIGDTRDIPTLKFPYGEVPILLCSAGIQRIVALAYLLVWTWQEHVKTAESMRREPERSIVLLIDEMEAHLHPFWQRTIVPALMNVVLELAPEVQTQIIINTHSPLVLASVETLFDEDKDKLFHLYQENGSVRLDELPFIKRGGVDKWLMSDVFGLALPRSIEAEEAIEEAKELQRKRTPSKEEVQIVSNKLINILAQDDDFWPRWTYFAEQRGVSL